jgi:hypothetical protein
VARIVLVSFRLGGTDGVAIESAKWIAALSSLGHRVRTVAGDGVADVIVPSLAIDATSLTSIEELSDAIDGADLVIVENLASLPLNLDARDTLYHVLEGRRALFHHHDLPWQRPHLAHSTVRAPVPCGATSRSTSSHDSNSSNGESTR